MSTESLDRPAAAAPATATLRAAARRPEARPARSARSARSAESDQSARPARSARRQRWVPVGLIALAAVPSIAGSVRLAEIAGGAEVTAANERFLTIPVPVVIHIITAVAYCVLGAFQFVPSLRTRGRRWHRYAGRLLVPLGLGAALSGLWLTLWFPRPAGDGDLLAGIRVVVALAMVTSIVLALVAVRQRNFTAHRAWMIRGYALGQGAGTQVFTHLPWLLLVGAAPGELPRAGMMAAGWMINAVVAEWIIRRKPAPRVREPASSTRRQQS